MPSTRSTQPAAGTLGGWAIIHIACDTGDVRLLQMCLAVPGVDLNLSEATRGETPLHLAVDDSNEAFVALLLRQRSILVDKASMNGSTALHFAAKREHCSAARRLLAAGADPNRRRLFRWRTPLHLACSVSSKGTVSPDVVRELLQGGADPNARDRELMTPAHVLAASGGGAASTGGTAAVPHHAVADAAAACAVALWRGGASFQLADAAGLTPYATAVRYGHPALAAWMQVLESDGGGLRNILDDAITAAGGRASAVEIVSSVLRGGGAGAQQDGTQSVLGERRFTRVRLPSTSMHIGSAHRDQGSPQGSTPAPQAAEAAAGSGGGDERAPRPVSQRRAVPPTERFRGMALLVDLQALPDRALGRISELWGGCWSHGSDVATKAHIDAEAAARRSEVRGRSGTDTSASSKTKDAGDKKRQGASAVAGQEPDSAKSTPSQAQAQGGELQPAPVSQLGTVVAIGAEEDPEDPPAPPLRRDDSFEQD